MLSHGKKWYFTAAAAVVVIVTAFLFLPGFSGLESPPETIGGDVVQVGADLSTGEFDGTLLADPEGSGQAALFIEPSRATGEYVSEPRRADYAFNALGLHWKAELPPGSWIEADVRFSQDGSAWGEWVKVNTDDPDLPDHFNETSSAGETIGQLAFADEARFYQYRLSLKAGAEGKSPALTKLTASYIDAKGYHESLLSAESITARAGSFFSPSPAEADPAVISRAQWGANEAYMTWAPEYQRVKKIIVHHTVTSNYDPDPAATVRSIYYYHAVSLGWGDIGYNFLVDREGRIYEGRYGGNAVIGGHALTWNYGSVGIAGLGNYEAGDITQAMYNGFVEVMVWKSNINAVDPWGNDYHNGIYAPNYLGHRDIGQTACPGANLYSRMNSFRNAAYARYSPIPIDSPRGQIDSNTRIPGGLRLTGWALDPDTTDPIDVHFYVDDQMAAIITADEDRPDVEAAFPGSGSAHGFTADIDVSEGEHKICAYGFNVGPGDNNLLNCLVTKIDGDPFGNIDSAGLDAQGRIETAGWAIDPDTVSPIDVEIFVNGLRTGVTAATGSRPDIETAFPDYGAQHGWTASAPILGAQNTACAFGVNAGAGQDSSLECRTLSGGWDVYPLSSPPAGLHYYWPWYDSVGGANWVFAANPSGGQTLNLDLNIGKKSLDLSTFGGPGLGAGDLLIARYGELADGPVVATSITGAPVLASQRMLWKGKSLEEVPATESGKLSSHFYWTWYDQSTPGYQDWLMISNPGSMPVYYEITIEGTDPGGGSTGVIAAGGHAYASFPGKIGGPVELKAWAEPERITPVNVIASQRVLTGNGEAFNEVPGIPETDLNSHYLWTWYDMQSPGASDWVIVANKNDEPVYYQITIAGEDPGEGSTGMILPGATATPTFAGLKGGPVEVEAWSDASHETPTDVISSQRTIWGPSMGETPGFGEIYEYPVTSSFAWTWYDQLSSGSLNWIMVANPNATPVYYEITIAGEDPGSGSRGTIQPGDNVIPTFAMRGGPVEVRGYTDDSRSQPATIMASQRVLWQGYFNEVIGTVLR